MGRGAPAPTPPVVRKSAAHPVSLPGLQVACYNTDPTIPLFTSAPRALLLLAANARGGGALGRVQVRGGAGADTVRNSTGANSVQQLSKGARIACAQRSLCDR